METMFEYELRMTKPDSHDEKPVTVRAANFDAALATARAAMPSRYAGGEVFLTSVRQLSVNEQRVVELEERNAFLEASFGEAQAEVVRLQAIVDSDADELGVLRNAFNRQSHALTVIWQLSDEDTAGAAKDAARPILNDDPTGFVTAPEEKEA